MDKRDRRRVTFFRWARRAVGEYLYPARCICCREKRPEGGSAADYAMLADPDSRLRGVFCAECLRDFERSCGAVCKRCRRPAYECECAPDGLRASGVRRAYACFTYERGRRESASSSLIFSLKNGKNRDAVNYAAHLLRRRIRLSGVFGGDLAGAVLTYAPRGRKNSRLYGDHMMRVAELAAELVGCEFEDVFENASPGEQKKRGLYEREHDARSSIYIRPGADVSGRRLLIVDDVITSGATLGACVDLARDAGAREIAVFALAKTAR